MLEDAIGGSQLFGQLSSAPSFAAFESHFLLRLRRRSSGLGAMVTLMATILPLWSTNFFRGMRSRSMRHHYITESGSHFESLE